MTNTPKPEALASLVERLKAIPVWMVEAMTPGWQDHGTTAYEAATTLETLSADLCAKIAQNSELEADVAALRDALERVIAIGDAPVETPVGRINPGEMARAATMRIGAALVQLFPDIRTTLERTAQP